MAWLSSLLLVVQVLCALAVIVLVLIQQGKGADMGAAFGSSGGGASGSLFGATGFESRYSDCCDRILRGNARSGLHG
jgi:protein translocase SecG subunit